MGVRRVHAAQCRRCEAVHGVRRDERRDAAGGGAPRGAAAQAGDALAQGRGHKKEKAGKDVASFFTSAVTELGSSEISAEIDVPSIWLAEISANR